MGRALGPRSGAAADARPHSSATIAVPMNLLLLRPGELTADGTARLTGRRLLHAREVLRVTRGDMLRVGVLEGALGVAEVLHLDAQELVLRPRLTEAPPTRPGIDLLLAVPRPK